MPAWKQVAPELIAEGKYLYEQTLMPTDQIGAKMGLSRSAFYLRVKEWKWKRRRYSSGEVDAPAAPPVPVADTGPAPAADEPLPFAERMQRVLDAEMAVIERTLKVLGPASNAEAERTTRILAMISRTVQEIQASAEGQTHPMKPTTTPYPAILTNSAKSLRAAFELLSELSAEEQAELAVTLPAELPAAERELFMCDFSTFAHEHQLPPERANSGADWTTWLMLGGRGAGKTRAGAEWVRALALARSARRASRWSARPSTRRAR